MVLNNAVKSSKSRRKWKNTEQCREPERARAQERKRNTQKIDSEGERTFQINSRDEINVQPCKEQSYNSSGDPQEKSNVVRACV